MSTGSSPATQPLVLTADAVSVRRGERTILARVSLRVEAGSALMVAGVNGAGKTTLLRTIAGFLQPASGRILLTGGIREADAGDTDSDIAQRCHFAGHLDGIKGALTVAENLTFWTDYLAPGPGGTAGLVDAAMARLGLDPLADIPAAYLSAGQKRRLGLARLLVAERPLWLLDEPTVSLDAASVDLLRTAIAVHLAGGGIVLAATHVDLGLPGSRTLRLGTPSSQDTPAAAGDLDATP